MARGVFLVKRACQIDTINIDSCKDESHTLSNTVTDHPVEEGFNPSDHSRPDPDVVNLSCFVSNTPLSTGQVKNSVREGEVDFQTTLPEVIGNRGDDTYKKLKKLRDEGTLIQVVTTLRTYGVSATEGMSIQSITIPRTRQNYDGLEFQITLKQVRIVRNRQTQDTAPKEKNTQVKKKKGSQTTEETPPESFDSAVYKAGKYTGLIK